MLLLFASLVAGALPFLDPVEGERISAEDAESLPSGRHLGWEADHLFPSPVNLQPGDGGLSRFDRLTLSAHGRSFTQLHLLLNGLDITDPARPGVPLLEIPDGAWDALTHRSLWTDRPGFEWTLSPPPSDQHRYRTSGGWGRPLGGGTWIPRNFMDREPATASGAPADRRALTDVTELRADGVSRRARIFADYARDSREFPVTYVDANGRPLIAVGERTTVIGTYGFDVGLVPVTALLAWQRTDDDGAGAAYRWPAALTGAEREDALVGQISAHGDVADWRVGGQYGFGYRDGSFSRASQTPIIADLEGEWLWLARPRLDEDLSRWRNDLQLSAERRRGAESWLFELRGSYASLSSRAAPPAGVVGHTYERNTLGAPAAYVDVYDAMRTAKEWFGSTRATATLREDDIDYRLEAFVALDYAATGSAGTTRLGSIAPAAGAALRKPLGGGELFALLRREPDAFTEEVSAFLDPNRPSWRRYAWVDDGDGVPQAREAGALVSRFGGPYQRAAGGLRRPSSNQLAFGYVTPTFAGWRAIVSGVGRMHLNRYTVRYDQATADTYSQVAVGQNGQGPAGTPTLARGSGPETAYARTGAAGAETYLLDNDRRPDFWAGAEVEIATVDTQPWFLSLSAAGYWNPGAAPFGSFPDRNDPGIIDAASADPNARINDYGRYDQDRAFSIKLLAGRRFWEQLLVATALRYRDGEPFSEISVIEGLPQGPTPVMLVPRGRVRHTFHMSLDVHVAYAHASTPVPGLQASISADVVNLLGSGTELLEDPRSGPTYRRALEMVPGRAAFLRLTLDWNPD
jgi:hypothetical protein